MRLLWRKLDSLIVLLDISWPSCFRVYTKERMYALRLSEALGMLREVGYNADFFPVCIETCVGLQVINTMSIRWQDVTTLVKEYSPVISIADLNRLRQP